MSRVHTAFQEFQCRRDGLIKALNESNAILIVIAVMLFYLLHFRTVLRALLLYHFFYRFGYNYLGSQEDRQRDTMYVNFNRDLLNAFYHDFGTNSFLITLVQFKLF